MSNVPNAVEKTQGYKVPYRDAVLHVRCKTLSILPRDVADFMARSPGVIDRLTCTRCRGIFVLKEFAWNGMPGFELDGVTPKPAIAAMRAVEVMLETPADFVKPNVETPIKQSK